MKLLSRLLLLGAVLLAAPGVSRAEYVTGLTTTNQLFNFDSATPATISPLRPVTGLATGTTLVGIDFRPANGLLYGVGATGPAATRTGTVYQIDIASGAATSIFSGIALGNATTFGVDFNPFADALRITSNATNVGPLPTDIGNNYRLAGFPTGTLVLNKDGNLNGAATTLAGSAYTNNIPNAPSTQLFGISADSDALYLQDPPNPGTLVLRGALGTATNNDVGFDISGETGVAFASLNSGRNFGTINLGSGVYTNIGNIGAGTGAIVQVADIAVSSVPEPGSLTLLGLGGLCLAGYLRRRRRA